MKSRKPQASSSINSFVITLGSVVLFFFVLLLLWSRFPHDTTIDKLSQVRKGNQIEKVDIGDSAERERPKATTSQMTQPPFVLVTTPPVKVVPVAPVAVPTLGMDTVLLIIASNRPDYLKRTLSHVVKHHPRTSVPIFISEDGSSGQVKQVIQDAREELNKLSSPATPVPFVHKQHPSTNQRYENGYFKLADHFKWALNEVFTNEQLFSGLTSEPLTVQRVIILEEDLEIAPDFFEFFAATKDMLDHDESLLAVSAWNDNGLSKLVRDNKALYRSDFFPGLGWMMTRRLWVDELAAKWPRAYWDDWLREPKQRQGRHILRPEVCRTLHFGTHGVSNAQYSDYLNTIQLNQEFVPFTHMDLNYLTKSAWDREYIARVRRAPLVSRHSPFPAGATEVRVRYEDNNDFPSVAHWAGAMDNIKANVPRTAYRGVVSVWRGDVKVHLVPPELAN